MLCAIGMQFFFHKALIKPPQELSKGVKNNNVIPMHATKQQAHEVQWGAGAGSITSCFFSFTINICLVLMTKKCSMFYCFLQSLNP